MEAALYFHIPFCVQKCAYCDFASFAGRGRDMARYFDALWRETRARAAEYGRFRVPTVFFGGGTPSLPDASYIEETLNLARSLFDFAPECEITIEGNPNSLTTDKLERYRRAGINRLSMGVQAAQDRLLSDLGRAHKIADAENALRRAKDAGFVSLSVDLLYGLPGQTADDLLESVEWAVSRDIPHLSLYSLIVEDGTPMKARVDSGACVLPDEDETLDMQRRAISFLARRSYERYEISNYAKPGFACRHNEIYWRRGDYLGLGSAAHSLMRGARFANPAPLDAYLSGAYTVEKEILTDEDIRLETVMLGLRTREGVPKTALADRTKKTRELIRAGFLRETGENVAATERGAEVLNALLRELV